MPLWRTCISQTQITGGKHGWKMFLPYEISAHKANGPLQPERLRALHLFNQSLIKNSKDIASSHPLYTKLIYQSLVKSKNLFLGGGGASCDQGEGQYYCKHFFKEPFSWLSFSHLPRCWTTFPFLSPSDKYFQSSHTLSFLNK